MHASPGESAKPEPVTVSTVPPETGAGVSATKSTVATFWKMTDDALGKMGLRSVVIAFGFHLKI